MQLTICIPTFNRVEYLRECLEAFLPQVAPHQIPICVSDNGSSDGTLVMLEAFKQTRYPLLSFRANTTNRGIDQNMVDVLAMASGTYAWLFGDDDLPRAEAIDTVMACLNGQNYKLLVVNASTHTADLGREVEERRVRLPENRAYDAGDHERLMIDTASYITYLGGIVVDLASWRSVDHTPFLGTDYLHVSVVLRYIVGQRALLCAAPLIRLRLQPPTWLSRYFEVEMVNWPKTVWSLDTHDYSDAAKQAVVDEHPMKVLRRIAAMRAYGHYNRATYDRFIAGDRRIGAVKQLVFRAIAGLPATWFRAAFIVYMRALQVFRPASYQLGLFRLTEASKWQ